MKIRIREGNDFDVVWAIKRAGVPEDLSTAINMKLTLVVYGLVIEHNLFTVTDNLLSINIPKEVATVNGDYRLIFEYTLPDAGQPDGDLKCKTDVVPFRIVPFTAKADDIYTINVTSDIAIGLKGDKGDDGADAYQIWLDLGNEGTYEDFIAYLRQPAVDAGAIANTAAGNANSAATAANTAATAANTAAGLANNAATTANTAAEQADTARLAIQDDLALKANHGYTSNPKTLKQVDDELVQLAGEVDFLNTELTKASPNISDNIFTNSNVRADGTYAPNSNNWISLMYQPVPANQIIRIKGIGTVGTTVTRLAFRSSSGTFISSKTNTELGLKTNFTIQTPADIDGQNYVQIAVTIGSGANVGVDLENSPYKDSVMISIGEEDYPFSKKGTILTEKLEELLYGNTEDIKYNKFESAYISTTGDDVNGDGSFSKPLKTISKAKTLLFNKFILLDGIYESNDLDMSTGGEMTALNKGKAIVRGSERITINAVTLDSGDVYKADMGIPSLHINNKGVWVHNIPDSTTMIEASKRLPNFGADNHRLKSTRIVRVYSMDDLLTHNGNACYTENSTIYVRGAVVSSISSTNPIIISAGRLKLPISGNSPKTTVKGIAMEYMGVFILSEAEFVDCSLFYTAYSGFTVEDATATIKNCRIGGVDNNGIGYGGSTSNSKGIEVNNLIHDAKDQGSSAHGVAEVYRENCLFVHCNEGVADVGRAKSHFVGCHFLYNSLFDIRFTFSGSPNDGSALIVNCSGNAPNGVASGADNNLVVMNSKFTGTMSPNAIVI